MRRELEPVLSVAQTLALEELPRLLGDIEEIKWIALGRLTSPVTQRPLDELVDVREAARRLGISTHHLYRRHSQFPFTRRVGRRLLFSSIGIEQFIKRQNQIKGLPRA